MKFGKGTVISWRKKKQKNKLLPTAAKKIRPPVKSPRKQFKLLAGPYGPKSLHI